MDAAALNAEYLGDETTLVRAAADRARLSAGQSAHVQRLAVALVERTRAARSTSGLDAFLSQYDLDSREGVLLMCLAEALLRIPDAATADALIAEKIGQGDWTAHAGDSESLFVNASTWSLMLTGRIVQGDDEERSNPLASLQRLVTRLSEPVLRAALRQAMRILGSQFVMGRTIEEALERARDDGTGERHSFDMLGEGALTLADAGRYLAAYRDAIETVSAASVGMDQAGRPSISVKLSALHPRFESSQAGRMHKELLPVVMELARHAARHGVPLTLDAEEAERLTLQLEIVAAVMSARDLSGWKGFGLAVQAYQRRAPRVIEQLVELSVRHRRELNLRLVKGAYWDSEIKRAQERGLATYPVYTRKCNTDVSWLACARRLFEPDASLIHPQFATHNAHTVAYVLGLSADAPGRDFEFQRLHGMGQALHRSVPEVAGRAVPCRVYAPVGSHEALLPYLVRRLLENGANTSFVNRIVDERLPPEEIVQDPVVQVDALENVPHPSIPDPPRLFGESRTNSRGMNLADPGVVTEFHREAAPVLADAHSARPLVMGLEGTGSKTAVLNPARTADKVGAVVEASADDARVALEVAAASFSGWVEAPASERAACLRHAADLFESRRTELMALCVREAGKTLPAALAEVREAVDFLRYYAERCERDFGAPVVLPGPTGERNELALHGRGIFVCISPWNFPLAIFTGQVAAALAAGNTVIAKPAEQTPLVAARAVQILHAAGIPEHVLSFLPGDGPSLGSVLLADPRVAGVAFTGSTAVAQLINRQLAAREGAIGALIAETGGQNAMLVDSSALPEQVVLDAVTSAFDSAGQRCSALRVLFVQQDIADRVTDMLRGYMDELVIGDPARIETDIGPVIDAQARGVLEAHVARLAPRARWLHRTPLPKELAAQGHFFAPTALEIDSLSLLEREVFGPVLHVIRYRSQELERVVDAVNATGFGLTLGVQTRIEATANRVAARARVGNVYVNRNIIGAVVGVQPFGGCGLSGTGPKAGGPQYLHRFATERTVTTNTAAVGGNAGLLSMDA